MKEPNGWNENKAYGGKTFAEEARATTFIVGIIVLMAALFWIAFVIAALGVMIGWW